MREKVKATVITKRIKSGVFCSDKYMLGLRFYDIYNVDNNENTKEIRVSYIAYQSIEIGDEILCPMIRESRGLTFDFNQAIEHI